MCIHGSTDALTCKPCNRKKDVLVYKKEPMNNKPSQVSLEDYIKLIKLL